MFFQCHTREPDKGKLFAGQSSEHIIFSVEESIEVERYERNIRRH